MKLLLDQNLSRSLVVPLSDAGHDVMHTSGLGLEKATDPEVFLACVKDDRTLVTGDKKLTKFLAATNATGPSVVIVRGFGGPTNEVVAALINNLELVNETVGARGNAVFSIGPDRPMRVQLLPLGAGEPAS